MSSYDIKARFFGNAFAGNISDLQVTRLLNKHVRSIIESLIALHLGRNELADEIKNQIRSTILTQNNAIEIGVNFENSLCQKFGISEESSSHTNLADEIAELFYSAMTLRKLIAGTKLSGQTAKILLNEDSAENKRSVIKTEKGNILLSHLKILLAAQMTKQSTDSILSLISDGRISGFEFDGLSRPFVSNKDDSIVIGQNRADLVAVASFKGRIDNLFFSKRRGIVVADDDVYQISWDDSIKSKILNHADLDDVEFLAKPCIETHSLYGELIVYKVLDCKTVQYSLDLSEEASQKVVM